MIPFIYMRAPRHSTYITLPGRHINSWCCYMLVCLRSDQAIMGEVAEQIFLGFSAMLQKSPLDQMYGGQMMVRGEEDEEDLCDSSISTSADTNESDASSSMDSTEEVTSSSSSSSSPHMDSNGPLYELSSLMSTLPIKRGLSKHFQGKSQSFTSLSRVTSTEDLAKKEIPYKRKMKPCKSYAGGLDSHKSSILGTKSTITKKPSRGSCSSLLAKRSSSLLGGRPPIPLQKN